jgi:hypothetical protein
MLDPTPIRRRKRLWALGLATGTVVVAMALATRGQDPGAPPIVGVIGLLYAFISGGLLAGAYLGAGIGLGLALLRLLLPDSSHRAWIALVLGPGLLTYISHALGVLGLLSGPAGQFTAAVTLVAGLSLLAWRLGVGVRARPNLPQPPVAGLLWVLPAAVLLLASCNPPGWLWESEAFGYDALSYHLQLPQEWARGTRLWPLAHNVYSYLPGGVESAFLHISALTGGGIGPSASAAQAAALLAPETALAPVGLLAHDGAGAVACQLLHAGFAMIASVVIARIAWALLTMHGIASRPAAEAGAIAGAAALSVPWVTVVGSLPYNEMAVNALLAGAVLAAIDPSAPWRRGLATGALVGLAVTAKPTAAFLAAPLAGFLLLSNLQFRQWWAAMATGSIAGALAIAPFMIRNYLASGNPIFPAGTSLFGTGHWNAEQVARFALAHRADVPFADRLGLLLSWQGDGLGGQPRGLLHAQWSVFAPIGLAALLAAAAWRPARRDVLFLLAGAAAMLIWWLGWSHCQSRFLIPMIVPLAIGIGLLAGRATGTLSSKPDATIWRLVLLSLAALPLLTAATGARLFLSQRRVLGDDRAFPNLFLADGTTSRTGEILRRDLPTLPEPERSAALRAMDPEACVNLLFSSEGPRIYLLGGATPFYFTTPVRYHTTWDASPVGDAARAFPDQPERWGDFLRARGIEYILADFAELSRLARDGWYDPAITPEAAAMWLLHHAQPVREWTRPGETGGFPLRGLYRLRPAGPKPEATL